MKATILVATTIKEFEREHVRSQKLSTDVRKRFRQVVNSLGIKISLINAGNIIYLYLLCFLRHYFAYVVVRLLKSTLVFELVT